MESLVSIIVPVFNAEEYIHRCIDSILKQEYQNFELLLVDDGSTDRSGKICREYAGRDSRVHVIQKENTGVSASRNLALKQARGTYIQFLDSDDWIAPEATRLLVRSMETHSCDMVIADFYRVSGEYMAQKGDINENKVLSRQEFSEHMMENPADFYYGVLWNKMYRRDIIEDHQIRMDESLNWCEDFLFNLEYIRHAHSFYALPIPIYYYRKRKGSLASQGMNIISTMRMKINVFEYYNGFYKDIYDKESYDTIRFHVYKFLLTAAKDGMVAPLFVPGVKKLGEEKKRFHTDALEKNGFFMDQYRTRKLLAFQLDYAAKKSGLSMEETYLLFCLMQSGEYSTIEEMADFTGLTPRKLSLLLQKLEKKKLIQKENQRKKWKVVLTPETASLQTDLRLAEEDVQAIRFSGFTEEELLQYKRLEEKIQEHTIEYFIRALALT